MGLADYKPVRREIALPDGGHFEVRALSLGDIGPIMVINQEIIELLVEQIAGRIRAGSAFDLTGQADIDFMSRLLSQTVQESPVLAGAIIAYASDEPMQAVAATKLPLTVQLDALQTIAELTFTDLAALKKFQAGVIAIWRGIVPSRQVGTPALVSVA